MILAPQTVIPQIGQHGGPLLAQLNRLREENDMLREALGLTHDLPLPIDLTPGQRKMLAVMLKLDRAARETLRLAIQATVGRHKDVTDPKMVDVMICKMRKALAPLGVTISTDWGFGYYLPAESKAKLRELIAAAK